MATALIVVDVQNDFCEGGSLAVAGGGAVARDVSAYLARADYDHAVATRDHHIAPGAHFADSPDFLDSWPPHCVVGTAGVELHPDLETSRIEAVFDKGEYAAAYSGFEGSAQDVPLADWLRARDVDTLDIVGIATDHCVRATALDAVASGFRSTVLLDLTAAVTPSGLERVLEEFRRAGVAFRGAVPGRP